MQRRGWEMLRKPASSGPWTAAERLDFGARVVAHSVVRLVRWKLEPNAFAPPRLGDPEGHPHELASARMLRRASSRDPRLARGRWHNLRLVAAALDGVVFSADRPFSFWRTVGRLSASRGFVEGAHYEGGCIVPAVGGGVCSLADALFSVALQSDCIIVERHGHTLWVADSGEVRPRRPDATVKWPYVDLRFAPRSGSILVSCEAGPKAIVLRLRSDVASTPAVEIRCSTPLLEGGFVETTIQRLRRGLDGSVDLETIAHDRKHLVVDGDRTCHTCGEDRCTRRPATLHTIGHGPRHRSRTV